MDEYLTYRAIDFAKDERFQAWVLSPSSREDSFWNSFLHQYPNKKAEVAEARKMILMLARPHPAVNESTRARIKQGIYQQIREAPPPTAKRQINRYWIAASVLLVVAASVFLFSQLPQNEILSTRYGEKKAVTLPDGSEITLKANSSLRYAKVWEEGHDREVWLEGEAFFHVNKQASQSDKKTRGAGEYTSFVVHAAEGIDISVLGTEFNVSSRSKEAEVALKSGRVRLEFRQDQQERSLLMKPGDLVEIKHEDHQILHKQIDFSDESAWKENMLIFDAITLAEVAQKLKYAYGVDIVFQDESLANRMFKGFVPSDDLEVLLDAFRDLYGIQIDRRENQIIFSTKPSTNMIE
ncbi:MAG: FecR domain-containing protein [Bacteroidota bacterium]